VVGRKQAENAAQPAQTSQQSAPKQLHARPETGVRKTVVPSVPTERRDDVILADENAIRAAIKAVRDDSSGTNWALVSYDAPKSKTLVLVGQVRRLTRVTLASPLTLGLVRALAASASSSAT
jgi:hypothetical protein